MGVVRRIFAHWRLLAGAGAAALVVAAYLAGASAAWAGYRDRIGSPSLSYDGHLEFTGSDFLSPLNSNMAFSGGISKQPAFSSSTQFLGTWGGHEYSGEARISDNSLYFNLSGPQMPVIRYRQSDYLLPLVADTWYQAALGDSLYDNICEHTQGSTVGGKLDFYRAVKNLGASPSPWVNFFSLHDGLRTVHLSGSLSGSKLASLYQAAQGAQPPGCNSFNTLGLSAGDLKHVTTHFDLYTNSSRDELVVSLADKTLGATAGIVLSTYKYGQPVSVTPPEKPISLNEIYAKLPPPQPHTNY